MISWQTYPKQFLYGIGIGITNPADSIHEEQLEPKRVNLTAERLPYMHVDKKEKTSLPEVLLQICLIL